VTAEVFVFTFIKRMHWRQVILRCKFQS